MKNPRSAFVLVLLLAALSAAPAAAQSRDLDSYLLFALDGIRTKGLTITGGDIGVNDPNGSISASSHGVIDAPQSDVVAGMLRASVRSRCRHLYSNVVLDPMPGCQPATGARSLALPLIADPLAACGFPVPFPDHCADAPPVIVGLGGTRVLGPGSYGSVQVFSAGGRSGRLVLTGGDYFFCALRTGRNAQIVFQHPATVKIRDEVNLGASGYLGPDPGASPAVSARDIELYVNGTAVHLSATSEARARIYAPNAMLRVTHESVLEGTFLARTIRTERIGTPPTTTTTTTPGGVTTTTTGGGSTTSTTLPSDCASRCGNGHIDVACEEQCDGTDFGDATCPGGPAGPLRCRSDCTIDFGGCGTTTTTLPGTGGRHEICGNCIDDDNNGLTDFEDPACCAGAQSFALSVRRGKLKPRGVTTRLRLKTILAEAGLQDVNPLKQDVFLQIRPQGASGDILCAKVPAMKFMRMHGAFKFRDRKHRVASAKGIDNLKIKVQKNGSVHLKTVGRHVRFTTPLQTLLQVTVGFRDPSATSEASNRCSTQTRAFRTGPSGRLIVP